MNVHGGVSAGGIGRRGKGKRKERILRVKRMEVHNIYTSEDSITKPTTHCLEGGTGRRGVYSYSGG
jgi:hypothetical protein